jgi:lipoprotein-anchoring transpeptidase ErfK/SrfK
MTSRLWRIGYVPLSIIAYNRARGAFEQAACWSYKVISDRFLAMRLSRRPLSLLAAGVIASGLAGIAAGSADAQFYEPYPRWKPKRAALNAAARPAENRAERDKPKAPAPQARLVVISIPKQRISVYGADGFHTQGAVSTGVPGHPTPTGVFSVIQKNRYHHSNIYSGAPMPFMQRITWSGVAMHAGVLPGYPASHGCIRLTHTFASELWGMTRMGVRVVVAPEDVQPVELAHRALPAPTLTPAPVAEGGPAKPTLVASAGDKMAATGEAAPLAPRLLTPLDRAKAARAKTLAEAPALAKAAKDAVQTSTARAREANKAIAALREAEQALDDARSRREAAVKAVEAAKTPEATERAKTAEAAAEAKLAEASKAATEAAAVEAAKTQEAFAAARAAWDAEKQSDAAAAVVRAGERNTEPISVFISKKTSRVYIRQAWAPIHEAPVTFKEPDTPLGIHLYVAMDPVADGKAMRWLTVSLAPPQPGSEHRQRTRRGDRGETRPAAQPARPRETAAGALERVELPEETRKFIADRLWAGASLIVSDQGLSHETGKYTDFIVQTR